MDPTHLPSEALTALPLPCLLIEEDDEAALLFGVDLRLERLESPPARLQDDSGLAARRVRRPCCLVLPISLPRFDKGGGRLDLLLNAN